MRWPVAIFIFSLILLTVTSLLSAAPDFGPDTVVYTGTDVASTGAGSSGYQAVDIAIVGETSVANLGGVLFVAIELETALSSHRILLFRSDDGGGTWAQWREFSGDQNEHPSLCIVAGSEPRLYLAYRYRGNGIRVSSCRLDQELPLFTHTMAITGVPGLLAYPDIVADADTAADHTLFVVANGIDGNGNDVWFTRSTDHAASFEPAYKIGDQSSTGLHDSQPQVDVGSGGIVHCVWTLSGATFDSGVRYRRAVNEAAQGILDWAPEVEIAPIGNGAADSGPDVAASRVNTDVLIGLSSNLTSFRLSRDSGATWLAADTASLALASPGTWIQMLALPASGGYAATGWNTRLSLTRASAVQPLVWSTPQPYEDHASTGGQSLVAPRLAYNPNRGNQIAAVWARVPSPAAVDSVFFDAEWPYPTDAWVEPTRQFRILGAPTPNPVSSETAFEYVLPEEADIALELFDVRGRLVRCIDRGRRSAGMRQVIWDVRDPSMGRLPGGHYVVRLQIQTEAGVRSETRKVTVLY